LTVAKIKINTIQNSRCCMYAREIVLLEDLMFPCLISFL